MNIQYLITESNQNTPDLSAWVESNLPHLVACGFLKLGTDHTPVFKNSDLMGLDELKAENLIKLDAETLIGIETIIRTIREFGFHVKGHLSKYNPHKKVFIIDLQHRIGDLLEDGVTIEALSTISCTLNDDNSFTIDPETLSSTHASCWFGEDDWFNDNWVDVAQQSELSVFIREFKDTDYGVNVEHHIIAQIDKLYKESIQNNLQAFTKQAEAVALVP